MSAAPLPPNEASRLTALQSYAVLDTACEAAFDNLIELAAELTESPISLMSLVDSQRQWFKAKVGIAETETSREHSFCAHAIANPVEPLVVEDARDDPRFADNPLVTGDMGIRFYAGIPLVNPEGAALGTLCVLDREPRQWDAGKNRILARLADAVMTTLELRKAMAALQRAALLDFLTGLPNRTAMIDAIIKAIARLKRHDECFSLLYIDLDGFKKINDALGHAAGDAVLREVAAMMHQAARAEDTAARLGGDEFALLIVGAGQEAAAVGDRFRTAVNAHMRQHGWAVTASIGLATFLTPPASVEAALGEADRLMYQAKAAGRDRVVSNSYS